jgi:hypothetical protein
MGVFTPNIGLYIPGPGETNFNDAFASGMINLDQHDHSGGPNKGLPISSTGLADFSVTYDKLNSNVADVTTGIGVNSATGFQNQLQLLGVLRNIYALSLASGTGFLSINGSTIAGRTFQNSSTATWTNPDGIAGNPSVAFNIAGISPVTVPNGGTGLTSDTPYALFAGGTTSTSNFQQVSGLGTASQYLGSNGPGALPSWQTLPTIPPQTVFQATVTMTAAQFRALSSIPFQLVAAQGAGAVIVPITVMGKVNVGSAAFGGGSAVILAYGSTAANPTNIRFDSGTFDSATSGYYLPTFIAPSTSGIPLTSIENQGLYISVNSSAFTGGGTSTVVITVFYSVISI